MKLAILGDRSADPGAAFSLVQTLLLSRTYSSPLGLAETVELVTGPHNGVEGAVRFLQSQLSIKFEQLEDPERDWAAYAEAVALTNPDEVLFVHGQPETSRIWPELEKTFDDGVLTLVTPVMVFN